VDPQLLRANFALALFIMIGAFLILPFEDRSSAGFVVTILAIVVGLLFVGAIMLLARWSSPHIPDEDDKASRTRYTGRRPGGP
jgi:predicted MFS family arabinose efflux permease